MSYKKVYAREYYDNKNNMRRFSVMINIESGVKIKAGRYFKIYKGFIQSLLIQLKLKKEFYFFFFGTFKVVKKPDYKVKNGQGRYIYRQGKYTIEFEPSKFLLHAINDNDYVMDYETCTNKKSKKEEKKRILNADETVTNLFNQAIDRIGKGETNNGKTKI